MQSLNTLDTNESIDYDNLSIITRPRPPRRRQSGKSLVPFRPYVKCLSSVRQPLSFTNGYDKWMVTGGDEVFFTQQNARCIGSFLDDCDISDVIRWDIEGESTRLPMMCKLWIIVDGAVVERGKPRLVQDAAMQIFTPGKNLRAILEAEQRYNQPTTYRRRRRQSWHDINEYHSVSYHQYTYPARSGYNENIQCNLDDEHLVSVEEVLSDLEEEEVQEIVYYVSPPQDRVRISNTTPREPQFVNQSTAIDSQFIQIFNLHLETNKILLSSIVNSYHRAVPSIDSSEVTSTYRNGIHYKHRSVQTGDDYPHWWCRLTTDLILSNYVTNQGEEKEKVKTSPSPRQEQGVQTDIEEIRPLPSTTTINHYEIIDEINDGNITHRIFPLSDHRHRVDSLSTDYQIENPSMRSYSSVTHQSTSTNHSETDYNTFVVSLKQQPSYSPPDCHICQVPCRCFLNETIRRKTYESTSASLFERYERSLRDRQRAIAVVNDQLLDIDDVLKHYRDKIQNLSSVRSNTTMQHYRDISLLSAQSKEDRPSLNPTNIVTSKYRLLPGITSEEMIQGYTPSPRLRITNSLITSPRLRQPPYVPPSTRPGHCDLCLTDHHTSSAWIKYNERRIEDLHKRIDLMLQIDENEEARLLLTPIKPTTATVTQRIDDILLRKPRSRCPLIYHSDRTLSPRRYDLCLPYRLNHSLPTSPRLLSRNVTRSTTPTTKSVRISTQSVPPCTRLRQTRSASRPITSILCRNNAHTTPRPSRLGETSHVWQSKVDGEVYALERFSIPRYYRLYNDVSFREMYNFARVLDTYLDRNQTSSDDYSSFAKNFALEQQMPSPIRSAA